MYKFKSGLAVLGVLFFFLNEQVAAQSTLIKLDPQVRTGKLPNGFTYYIRHNEEPKHRVTMYLANKVGSIIEDEDQRGIAHFMEHMSFNGTKHFPKNNLVDYLQKSGVRFGADLNAYTSFDETVYQLPLPADDPKLLQGGLDIMRDWAQEALLDPVEINKERGIVLEEKRLGKGASERMQRVYWPVILKDSRYAVRVPIGVDTVLNNFKPAVIKRFYHDWYRPDLQALIIVGDINVAQMEKRIKAQFSDLKNPVNERKRVVYTAPVKVKNEFIAVTDKEMTRTTIQILVREPKLVLKTTADFRATLIRNLYNQMIADRYAELMQQENPPFLQAGAGINGFIGNLDAYCLYIVAKPGELENGFKSAWRVSEQLRRFGFTATELDRAKNVLLTSVQSALKESSKTNSESYAQAYQQNFLSGSAEPGIQEEYTLVSKDLPTINLAEVNKIAKEQQTGFNRDIMVLAPEKDKESLPNEHTILDWIKQINSENIKPFFDNVSTLELLNSHPVNGNIVGESYDKQLGVTTIKLNNGVKVLLKPTDFKNDEILFAGFSAGGTSLYKDHDYPSASVAGNFIPSFGVGNYSNIQLGKYLSDKNLNVSPYISDRVQGISGSSSPKDLETAFRLIYGYYTEPRKDSILFKGLINGAKASIANRSNDPNSVFRDSVSTFLYHNNPRRTGPSVEKIDQIDLNKVYNIYRERFSNANGSVFVFVGNVDTTSIKPLLEKYLGSLPASDQPDTAGNIDIHLPNGQLEKKVYKGSEPKATVQLLWPGNFIFSQENVFVTDALKECLEIRLLERLREDESEVYTPSANVNTSKYPTSRYVFAVSFGCGPQNVEKLSNSTLDEISKLKSHGPPAVNLEKWKAETLRQLETEYLNNQWWESYLSSQILNHDDLNDYASFKSIVNGITREKVQKAAQEFLSGKNYIRLELLPEGSTGK